MTPACCVAQFESAPFRAFGWRNVMMSTWCQMRFIDKSVIAGDGEREHQFPA
jgi:hypothetical protein